MTNNVGKAITEPRHGLRKSDMDHAVISRSKREARGDVVPQLIAHIVFATNNHDEMLDWYMKVLNARIALQNPGTTFIAFDDEHHRIGIARVPRLANKNPNANGVNHIAFTYANLGALLGTYKRLAVEGIYPRWPMNHGITVSLYYQDPDGNRLELQAERFGNVADTHNYFEHNADFRANPFGAPFDPEKMLADYEDGVPDDDMLRFEPYAEGEGPMTIITSMGLGKEDVEI
ncbi:VOC family protein [Sphingobium boeckii]|uniref:VOC family protein n=1 Tax=Sphingobium boeckii TaxID=1082345 RepID=UPI0031B623AD